MKRFFAILALIVLSLGLMGSVAAQENATNTTNETASDELSVLVESIIEQIDPETAADRHVKSVEEWATNERLEELPKSERERVLKWLNDAGSQLPDRASGRDRAGDGRLGNATPVDVAEADTLEKNETIRFSDSARIIGWEFSDEKVRVAVQTEVTTTVTVSDALAGLDEEGAVTVPKTTQDLESGTHIVTLPVQQVQQGYGAAVTANGATVRLSTGMMSGESPFRYFGGESGLFTGMVLAIAMSGVAAAWVLKREESGVIKA